MSDDELAVLLALRALGSGLERSMTACCLFADVLGRVARACDHVRGRLMTVEPPYASAVLRREADDLARTLDPLAEPLEVGARELEGAVGDVREAMLLWSAARERTAQSLPRHDELFKQLGHTALAASSARLTVAEMANGSLTVARALPATQPVMNRIGVAARRVVVSCELLAAVVSPPAET